MKALIVFALLFTAFGVSSQPNPATNSHQKVSGEEKRETLPPTANNQYISNTYTETAKDDSPKGYASPEWWLVIIGFLTLGFVGWQAQATANAAKATRAATEATNKSLILQFRPKVVIRGGFVIDADRLEEATIEFAITNIGTSEAHLAESKLIARLVDSYYPADSLFVKSFTVPAAKLEPGAGIIHAFTLDKETTEAIQAKDFAYRNNTGEMGTKTILFAGTLNYRDSYQTLRQTGIFRRYDAKKKRFVPTDDPDYEYAN